MANLGEKSLKNFEVLAWSWGQWEKRERDVTEDVTQTVPATRRQSQLRRREDLCMRLTLAPPTSHHQQLFRPLQPELLNVSVL